MKEIYGAVHFKFGTLTRSSPYYIEINNPVKAFEAAALASKQHPNSVSIQLRKARVLLDKGKAVEALKILKRLENIEPGNHEIYVANGTGLGILGDIQGAKKMFDFALTLDSDDPGNNGRDAEIYRQGGYPVFVACATGGAADTFQLDGELPEAELSGGRCGGYRGL